MNKRKISIILVIVSILALSIVAYGADSGIEGSPDKLEDRWTYREENHRYRKNHLERCYEKGNISQAEKEKWENHYNDLDKFYEENGYRPTCQGEGCHSRDLEYRGHHEYKSHKGHSRNHHQNRTYQ